MASGEFDQVRAFLQKMRHKKQFSPKNNMEKLKLRQSWRVGPPEFKFSPRKDYKLTVQEEGHRISVKSDKDFISVFGNVGVTKGKWYYECVLETDGLMQIGFSFILN